MQPYPTWSNMTYPTYQNPINPYQERLSQLPNNNYQPQMQFAPMQQQMNQQNLFLSGQIVDGIDAVKAKDVDMTGNPVWYPKSDGTEIYRKQLQADGRSQICIYRLVRPEADNSDMPKGGITEDALNSLLEQFKQDIFEEIAGIKDLVNKNTQTHMETKPMQRGGNQK